MNLLLAGFLLAHGCTDGVADLRQLVDRFTKSGLDAFDLQEGGFEGGFRFGLVSAVGGAVGSVVCFAVGGWMCLHGCCCGGGLFRLGRRLR